MTQEAISAPVPSVRASRRTLRLARVRFALRWLALLAGGLVFASVFVYAVLSALKPPSEVISGRWLPSEWRPMPQKCS